MRSKFGTLYWHTMQKTWGRVNDFMSGNESKIPRLLFYIYEVVNIALYILSAIIMKMCGYDLE